MKNRIVQTIWFAPMKRGKINPYLHLRLAYASAKSIKAQGYELVCYTDQKDFLKDFPYDEVIEVDMSDCNPSLFCAIKYKALELEPIGSVHIDYDIILSKPCINLGFNKDILVQCEEIENLYKQHVIFMRPNTPCGIKKYGLANRPYCMGLIGFFNENAKSKFLENYYDGLKIYKDKYVPPHIILDYLFEQAFIPALSKSENYKVDFIIDDNLDKSVNGYNYSEDLEVGFAHYSGKSKWQKPIMDKWGSLLNENDMCIVTRNFCELCKKIDL